MNTHSIIVYRNPVEAWMWESGIAGCFALGLLVVIVVGLIIGMIKGK